MIINKGKKANEQPSFKRPAFEEDNQTIRELLRFTKHLGIGR